MGYDGSPHITFAQRLTMQLDHLTKRGDSHEGRLMHVLVRTTFTVESEVYWIIKAMLWSNEFPCLG